MGVAPQAILAMATPNASEDETSLQLEVASKRVAELDETRKSNADVVEKLEKELEEATSKAASMWICTKCGMWCR